MGLGLRAARGTCPCRQSDTPWRQRSRIALTVLVNTVTFHLVSADLLTLGRSSSGRTPGFESGNGGSSPPRPAAPLAPPRSITHSRSWSSGHDSGLQNRQPRFESSRARHLTPRHSTKKETSCRSISVGSKVRRGGVADGCAPCLEEPRGPSGREHFHASRAPRSGSPSGVLSYRSHVLSDGPHAPLLESSRRWLGSTAMEIVIRHSGP